MVDKSQDELSKYRAHLESLAEPRRRSIRRDAKYSGLLCGVFGAAVVFISAGMPAHRLARWIGVPLTIAFALSFAVLLFTVGNMVLDWLSRRNQ